ncbi:MAG: hypothetical protein HY906_16515 [Deltaproteobacteria bacterium]|nr:hypothetical protein [Deltaproteobacteria bacterium]
MHADGAPSAAALGSTETRPALARLDLPAALLVLAVLEVVLNRWGVRIFYAGPLARLSEGARVLDFAGRFAFNALALTGIATFCYLSVAVLWRGDLFSLPLRLLHLVALTYFLPAAAACVVTRGGSEALLLHLRAGATLVAIIMVVGVLVAKGEARAKCGALCLIVPVLCGLYAALSFAVPWLAPGGDMTGLPTHAHRVGESAVVAAAIVSFLCFMPLERARRLGGFGPLLLAVAVAVGAALVSARRFDLSVRAAVFGLGIELPLQLGLRSVYLAAVFALTLTVLSLVAAGGTARSRGVGVALFVLAGYQPQHPLHLLLLAVGSMAFALATIEPRDGAAQAPVPAPPPVVRFDDPAWRRYAAALKQALAAAVPPDGPPPEAVVVDGGEGVITRLRCEHGDLPLTLRFLCREGLLREIDFALGPTDCGPPLLSLTPRAGGRALGPVADGPVIETGDQGFDRAFKIRGRAEVADVFDAEVRARLRALQGWVGVWPGGGVRYHAKPGPPGALDAAVPSPAIAAGDPAAAAATMAVVETLAAIAARTRH